jgi:hypothetical protein
MNDAVGPGDAYLNALQVWDENGFDELSIGLIFCVAGGALLIGNWVSTAKLLGQNSPFILPILMLLILPLALTIKKVRARVVFPRTGYVLFRPTVSRKWIFLSFLALAAAQMIAEMLWRSTMRDLRSAWGPACGFLFAACLAWGAIRYKMPHYLWPAGLSLLLGGATFAAGAKVEGAIWVMLGTGLAMASEGALRLKRFLRTHPIAENRAEDHD